jgi:xanthine dehydrogenase accessory factor
VTDSRLLTRAGQLRSGRTPFVLATVVRAERPTSARPGDTALVLPDGTVEGFVGGACAESTTRAEGLRALRSGESSLVRITPDGVAEGVIRTVVNPCLSGGTLEIFFEAVVPPALVVVFGDAPVARALARVGEALEHEVRLAVDLETFTARLAPDTAAVVVASHGRDEVGVLAAALRAEVPYVALVASPKRAAGVLAELAASGVAAADCARVRAPAGLDIGARTPGEIALSIYAEALVRSSSAPSAASPSGASPSGAGPSGATDPVCGMAVAPVAASLHVEHAGETVWFCGPGCRQAFLADPARYAR